MNEIYIEISKMTNKFKTMCYGLTNNVTEIEDAVQELMMFFLNMNPKTLKSIWEKDGEKGIISYGAVVLKRALTSPRSPFYYKYKKYYTHIDSIYETNTTLNHKAIRKYLNNLPEIKEQKKIHITKDEAAEFYKVHQSKPFYNDLCSYLSSGPIVVMILEGENAVLNNRKLMGATDPKNADEKTIRKLFGISIDKNSVQILPGKIKSVSFKTSPYPGFASDMQAQFMSLMNFANGTSKIKEEIFENRFLHVSELNRMGAKIETKNKIAFIKGPTKLNAV